MPQVDCEIFFSGDVKKVTPGRRQAGSGQDSRVAERALDEESRAIS
jgi:hypothetical protein